MPPNKDNPFVLNNKPVRHELETPLGSLIVYVKPLSWIEQQDALSRFVSIKTVDGEMTPKMDLGGYWRYVLMNCITSTEPKLSKEDLFNLHPDVGNALKRLLPDLTDIIQSFSEGFDPLG
jgi:hypothetical protein